MNATPTIGMAYDIRRTSHNHVRSDTLPFPITTHAADLAARSILPTDLDTIVFPLSPGVSTGL
jgi:hypothetical protein